MISKLSSSVAALVLGFGVIATPVFMGYGGALAGGSGRGSEHSDGNSSGGGNGSDHSGGANSGGDQASSAGSGNGSDHSGGANSAGDQASSAGSGNR